MREKLKKSSGEKVNIELELGEEYVNHLTEKASKYGISLSQLLISTIIHAHPVELKQRVTKENGDPRVKEVLGHFYQAHIEKTGLKPIIDAKVGMLAKKLLQTYDKEKVVSWIDEFFKGNDFADRAGRTFGVFYSQVGKLASVSKPKSLFEMLEAS